MRKIIEWCSLLYDKCDMQILGFVAVMVIMASTLSALWLFG